MPRLIVTSLILSAVTLVATASAQDIQFTSNAQFASMLNEYDTRLVALENASAYGGESKSYSDYPCTSGLTFEAEATVFRYYRADGVRTVSDDNSRNFSFDLKAAPRFTVGYVAPNGIGIRARWWEFSQRQIADAPNPGDFIDVDTYNIDVELFHDMELNDIFDMEISGGVRYNEFSEELRDALNPGDRFLNEFDGIGLLAALEFRAHLYCNSAVFSRVRAAGVVGDKYVQDNTGNTQLNDTVQGMYELTAGYEYSRTLQSGAIFFAEVAGELQHWQNFSSGYEDLNSSRDFGGSPADVGFAGVVLSAGIRR
jgi:hypothetical protein